MYHPYHGTYPGISTLLDLIAKPALEKHKLMVGVKKSKETKEKFSNKGQSIHESIDKAISSKIENPENTKAKIVKVEDDNQLCLHMLNIWAEENIDRWLISNEDVVNHEIGYMGALDNAAILKTGEIAVIELKNTKRVYKEHLIQAVGYLKSEVISQPELNLAKDNKAIILRYDNFDYKLKPTVLTLEEIDLCYDCLKGLKNLWTLYNTND